MSTRPYVERYQDAERLWNIIGKIVAMAVTTPALLKFPHVKADTVAEIEDVLLNIERRAIEP